MGVPEVKQDHEWCPHAKPGCGGCAIYQDRPERCRDFNCQWLIDQRFGEYWKPSKSKIVVDTKLSDGRTVLCFIVDPTYPSRWREEPWLSDIKQMAKLGIDGTLGQRWSTVVMVKGEKIPIIGSATLLRPVLA